MKKEINKSNKTKETLEIGGKNNEANESKIADEIRKLNFHYRKNTFYQVRAFCAVVLCDCSITRASEKINLERSALSRLVSNLEKDLGTSLFDRAEYNKIKLTEEGELFYRDAINCFNDMTVLFENYNGKLIEHKSNNIKIASDDAILGKMMPFLYEFKHRYSNVNISLHNLSKQEAEKRLASRKLDLAFYLEDEDEKLSLELEQEKISDYVCYWVMSKKHELANKNAQDITEKDIAGHAFGIYDNLVFTDSFKNFIDRNNLKPPFDIENATINLLIQMAKTNFSISSISEIFLTADDKKNLTPITNHILPKRMYCCIFRKNVTHGIIVKEFIKMVKQNHEKIFH